MSLRLWAEGGGVPEGPVRVTVWSGVVSDEDLARMTEFAIGVEGPPIRNRAKYHPACPSLGSDINRIDLDVFAGQSCGEGVSSSLLLSGSSLPLHPEKYQGQDRYGKHDGEQNPQNDIARHVDSPEKDVTGTMSQWK